MLEKLKDILREDCQLDPHQPIVVGVSGGPDSLCVLDLIHRSGYSPIVAHFNHKLRPEADQEAEIIQQLAEIRGLPFTAGKGEVLKLAEAGGQSIEEAARNARYRFMFATAEEIGAQAVVVGHSADDQVETVLMHLLRGSGMGGLSGMATRILPNPWSELIPLVRPLLGLWRDEILQYCQEQGFEPIIDVTNQDLTYFRNRIRHELIPILESYNPSIQKVLWRTAEVLQGDTELVNQLVDSAWEECLLSEGPGYVAIDSHRGSQYPLGLQRQIIRRAISYLRPGLRDIGFNAVEQGREYLGDSQTPAEIDLIAGLKLLSEPGRLWVAEWEADLPSSDWPQVLGGEISLTIPGVIDLEGGWQLTVENVRNIKFVNSQTRRNPDPFQVWLDLNSIQAPLLVRARREGDRFQPLGMDGHSIKLSDLMINEKLPRRARVDWPLVCCAEQIVWVPGYRLAHPFRVSETTTEALKMKLTRIE